jgi:hypothetical protein
MRIHGTEVCDICGRLAEKSGLLDTNGKPSLKQYWAKFILGPSPEKGPEMGRDFPGIGSKVGNYLQLTLLHACDGCGQKVINFVKTGDFALLPDSPLKKALAGIALIFPRWKIGLKRQLQPMRMPINIQKQFGLIRPDDFPGVRPILH